MGYIFCIFTKSNLDLTTSNVRFGNSYDKEIVEVEVVKVIFWRFLLNLILSKKLI